MSGQQDDDTNIADKAYQETFSPSKRLSQKESETAGQSADGSSTDIKTLEQKSADAHWEASHVGDHPAKEMELGRSRYGRLRHGSAYAFILLLIIAGVWFSAVFAPNIILVNIKEMFTNDLSDATIALAKYNIKMMTYQIGKADCGNKDSIKCKLTTMPRQEVKALEKAGFTVTGDKVTEDNLDDSDPNNDKPESRYKVTSITFPHDGGTASDGDSFEQDANKSSALKALTYSVFNPKTSFFMDERYKERIKWRYDLTKNPTVFGDTEDAVNKSFDASMQGSNEEMDKAGQGNFSLKGLAGSVGQNGLNTASQTVGDLANSYVQLQCAYYTQAKITLNDAKRAKENTVARFAMQYLKAADEIKAGLSSGEMTANILSGKLAYSSDGGYNGTNATDAAMYTSILYGQSAKDSENGMKYYLDAFDSIGTLFPAWLQTVFITGPAIKNIANVPGGLAMPPADIDGTGARDYCLEGQKTSNKSALKPDQCPALTTAGTPPVMVPAVAAIAAGSTKICPPPPQGIWQMYPISTTHATEQIAMPYVANVFSGAITGWASNTANDFTSSTKGIAASDAIFAGTGEILGDMAQSRGMRPGDASLMTQYLAQGADLQKNLDDVAQYEGQQHPWDVTNKYSFLGTLTRSLSVAYTPNSPLISSVQTLLAQIPNSLAHLNPNANAFFYIQPRTFDASRLKCPDAEYLAIGLHADVACNVRYGLSQTDLNPDPQSVMDYMLKSHSDLTQKNVQELQQRLGETDFERDQADVQRQLDEVQTASGKAEIDEKTGKAIPHSEYDKFLTYCVNREDPWGRTGMAVNRKELSDDEKAKREKTKDQNGNSITTQNTGDPNETPVDTAYMAVTEGASADRDWYTGKKCLEESDELHNFRAYTMMCSVDGSHSGAADCTQKDHAQVYFDGFYNNNDVIYTSWW